VRAQRAARHRHPASRDAAVRQPVAADLDLDDDDEWLLRYVSPLDGRLPGPGATIIPGGRGYGLGRPADDPPDRGTRLDGLAAPALA
jgi:hypothetical protein